MVSFSCEVCNDTIVKKKLDQHQQRCYGAYFTCIDCSTTFHNNDHKKHTSCISEAEKYEKALYKPKKQQQQKQQPKSVEPKKVEAAAEKGHAKTEKKEKSKESGSKKSKDLASYLNKDESETLYKVIKKISQDKSKSKKDLLKALKVKKNDDGSVTVTF